MSTNAEQFAKNNESYVATYGNKKDLTLPPTKHVIIVTCIDARIDPAASLGLKEGEAHVYRNAGGRASEALRSIIISQRLLGTTEIIVYHNTDCGMLTFKDDDLRKKLKACTHHAHHPLIDQTSFLPFDDVEGSIKEDVEFLKRNPLILKESVITGWVYETETGKVRQVA